MDYVSGACNIGQQEIKRRYQTAIFGAALYLIFAIVGWQNFIFVPALIASIGFVQARKKFCVAFGLMGVFNFGATGITQKVAGKKELSEDRKYAVSVLVQGILLTAALTAPWFIF
ncbi:MAG: hypothetical protein RLZ57_873 [Actinomycetota bacterium]|jgi:hypothetical protein